MREREWQQLRRDMMSGIVQDRGQADDAKNSSRGDGDRADMHPRVHVPINEGVAGVFSLRQGDPRIPRFRAWLLELSRANTRAKVPRQT